MEKKKMSIYEIAREAGVSAATVSRVINQPEKVVPEKRERVLEIIRKYDFRPNVFAKSLKNARSGVIGLLTASVDSPFHGQLVAKCVQAAKAQGYVLLMASYQCGGEEVGLLEKIYEQRVESAILLGGGMDSRTENEQFLSVVNQIADTIPVVVMGNAQGVPCYEVRIDEGGAMEQAMAYLIGKGHRKIAFWGGMENMYSVREKRYAYQRMVYRNGLEFCEEWLQYGGYEQEEGYRLMTGIRRECLPMAVVSVNDQFACGVMKAAFDAGLRIPQELSVVSFDNTYLAAGVRPALSSVACDYTELAERLVETAVRAAQGENTGEDAGIKRLQLVGTSLTERESSGQIAENGAKF